MKFAKLSLILLGSLTLFTSPIEAKKPHQYHKMTHQMSHEQIQLYTHIPTQIPVQKIADSDTAPSLATEAAKAYGLYYLVSFYTTLVHEFGHAISAKLLLGCSSRIHLFPSLTSVGGCAEYYFTNGQVPANFNVGFKRAAVAAAGPLFGVGAGYCMLKLYNILSEYCDKSKSIKDAIQDGIKKPAFNEDQSLKFQMAVGLHGLNNICNLIPIQGENFMTDGARILQALQ